MVVLVVGLAVAVVGLAVAVGLAVEKVAAAAHDPLASVPEVHTAPLGGRATIPAQTAAAARAAARTFARLRSLTTAGPRRAGRPRRGRIGAVRTGDMALPR